MKVREEPEFASQGLLKRLKVFDAEIEGLVALSAHHVVVSSVPGELIFGRPVGAIDLRDEPEPLQELEGAIHGRQIYHRVDPADVVMNVIGGDVVARVNKRLNDHHALWGDAGSSRTEERYNIQRTNLQSTVHATVRFCTIPQQADRVERCSPLCT